MFHPEITKAAQNGNLLIVGAPGSGTTTAASEAVASTSGPVVLIDPLYLGVDLKYDFVDEARITATAWGNGSEMDECISLLKDVAENPAEGTIVVIDNANWAAMESADFASVLRAVVESGRVRIIATDWHYGPPWDATDASAEALAGAASAYRALGFDSVAFAFRSGRNYDSVVVSA